MEDKKSFLKFILQLVVIVCVTVFIFREVIIPIRVDGESMYPTLCNNDIGVVSALNIEHDGIERFDLVVLDCQKLDKRIVKRVIGLPGETVVYKSDRLYIDGVYFEEKFLDQEYIKEAKKRYKAEYFTSDFEFILDENEIFVLGDNRLQSADSRVLGPFTYTDIIGKNGVLLYPFSSMKWME